MLRMPEAVAEQINALEILADKNPIYIPIEDAAKFLRMDAENLKACIDLGRCPFAIGWQKNVRGYRAYKIPTVTFWLWYTSGAFKEPPDYTNGI